MTEILFFSLLYLALGIATSCGVRFIGIWFPHTHYAYPDVCKPNCELAIAGREQLVLGVWLLNIAFWPIVWTW